MKTWSSSTTIDLTLFLLLALSIPGLNAPIPEGCTYGYHLNGWGKPPIDAFGRPLYGGNPFDVPGTNASSSNWEMDSATGAIITSDGKTVAKTLWGCLPTAGIDLEDDEENESSEESSSEDDDSSSAEEMAESDEEGEVEEESKDQSSIANEVSLSNPSATLALRKQAGDETPAPAQQLYKVIQQTDTEREKQPGAVFASEKTYIVTGSALKVPEGAESVLSKAPIDNSSKRKRDSDFVNDDEDLGKKFKF
jgi:splicing factor 3B subunit 2